MKQAIQPSRLHNPIRFTQFIMAICLFSLYGTLQAGDAGFTKLGANEADAIINGIPGTICTAQDDGYGSFYLTLNQGQVDDIRAVMDSPTGRVYVDVITQNQFRGRGRLQYDEKIIYQIGDIRDEAYFTKILTDPIANVSDNKNIEFEVSRELMEDLDVGSTFTVYMEARARGELRNLCGEIAGGEVEWNTSGVILRTKP